MRTTPMLAMTMSLLATACSKDTQLELDCQRARNHGQPVRHRCSRQDLEIRYLAELPRPQRDSKTIYCCRRAKAKRALRRRPYRGGCSCQGMDGARHFKNGRSKSRDLVVQTPRKARTRSRQLGQVCSVVSRPPAPRQSGHYPSRPEPMPPVETAPPEDERALLALGIFSGRRRDEFELTKMR